MTIVTWWVPGAMALVGLLLLVLGLIGWRRAGPAGPGRSGSGASPSLLLSNQTASPKRV